MLPFQDSPEPPRRRNKVPMACLACPYAFISSYNLNEPFKGEPGEPGRIGIDGIPGKKLWELFLNIWLMTPVNKLNDNKLPRTDSAACYFLF